MNEIHWNNGESRLVLSGKNGAVLALEHRNLSLLAPAERAFSLRFLQQNGDYLELDDTCFSSFRFEAGEARWSECRPVPGLLFTLKIRNGEDGSFRFRPALSGIPADLLPDFIEAPHIAIPLNHELFQPFSEGVIVSEREKRNRKVQHIGFPDNLGIGYYPGLCQMQFLAAWRNEGGVCFVADDPRHTTKALEFAPEAGDRLGLRIETMCGGLLRSGSCELPFDLLLQPVPPGWQAACDFYRQNVVKRDPAMNRRFPLPEWLEESPVTVIYPVRGTGTITSEPNRFLPYENAFPRLQELAEAFDSKVMALLMRWEQHGPWHPPFYWPPVGGAESFRKLRDLLHGAGHLLGVYGSGTSFTMQSRINDYSGRAEYEARQLESCMARGPKGESRATICDMLRESETFCIAERKSHEIFEEQVRILAQEGVDYFQILDQNLGGASFLCYRKDHHHPPVPGAWQTAAMREFLDELNETIHAAGSRMLLGTECAAAGPYVAALPFNDLRDVFGINYGQPVPGFQYVFHRYANNFFGNQCDAEQKIDCVKSPDNLQFRLARAFCSGEMLSVMLRDSGEIDWGTASDWNHPAPPQEPLPVLIRNLNAARRRHREFLLHGELIEFPCPVECGSYTLHYRNRQENFPSIASSGWCAADGRILQCFVNFLTEPQQCRIEGKTYTIPPLEVLTRELPGA